MRQKGRPSCGHRGIRGRVQRGIRGVKGRQSEEKEERDQHQNQPQEHVHGAAARGRQNNADGLHDEGGPVSVCRTEFYRQGRGCRQNRPRATSIIGVWRGGFGSGRQGEPAALTSATLLLRFPAPGKPEATEIKRLFDHEVLPSGDIRASGNAKVEDGLDSGKHFRMREISDDETSNVCGFERNTEISGALARATVEFEFEGDLDPPSCWRRHGRNNGNGVP